VISRNGKNKKLTLLSECKLAVTAKKLDFFIIKLYNDQLLLQQVAMSLLAIQEAGGRGGRVSQMLHIMYLLLLQNGY
jgi:hypothetical protein